MRCQISLLILIALVEQIKRTRGWENNELCGKVDSDNLILGPGSDSGVKVPWTATFSVRSLTEPDFTRQALIISPYMVLTFAGKFIVGNTDRFKFFDYFQYIVTVNNSIFGDPVNADPGAKHFEITHITIHPGFQPGDWTVIKSDLALIHLKAPIEYSSTVRPICLPNTEELLSIIEEPGGENVILSGWNRNIADNMFLRLSVKGEEVCRNLWERNVSSSTPYENRFCALVGEENHHIKCIHRGVAVAKQINGSHYLAGAVSNFVGLEIDGEESRECFPETLYILDSYLKDETYQWISNSENCGPNNFTCHNGDCVSLTSVCNRVEECSDGSDENSRFCRGLKFCTEKEFACGVYGRCIPIEKVNDGIKDCEEGEDEYQNHQSDSSANRRNWIIFGTSGALLLIFFVSASLTYIWFLRKKIRNLTPHELDEFFLGRGENYKDNITGKEIYANDYIQVMPWTYENEIPFDMIHIKTEVRRGHFGIVYKAKLGKGSRKGSYENNGIDVAVKTHKSDVNVEEFKALLCELKIFAYVGTHENIVSFIGACTENIRKRSVFMVIEYCPLGDLRNFLIDNSLGFHSQQQLLDTICVLTPTDTRVAMSNIEKFSKLDLIKWCSQIARGMEHLSNKKIIHGDLAARNILLSGKKVAKISDFGLSRHLGVSGVYVKTSSDPVPWKWMAIESIENRWFTEKSDVWSYGVTVWEIFSLGGTPYEDKEFGKEFVTELKQGERLACPVYANEEMYGVMRSCWEEQPSQRPMFSTLGNIFERILHPL